MSSRNRLWYYLMIVVLLLACVAIYTPHMSRAIWYDEAFTYIEYAGSPLHAFFDYTAPNNHLFHSFLVWLSTTLAGDSLIAIRFPAFAAAILSLAYLYRMGKRLKDHQAGLLAMLILAAMQWFMFYATNARGYTLTILLALMSFEFVYFGHSTLSRTRQRYLVAITLALLITLPTMMLFIASLGLWLLLRVRLKYEQRHLQTYIRPVIFGVLLSSIFYLSGILSGRLVTFSQQFGFENTPQLITGYLDELNQGGVVWFLLIGFIGAALFFWQYHGRYLLSFALIFTVPVALAFVQEILTGGVLFPRNYLYLLPFIALIAGIGLNYLLSYLPVKQALVLIISSALIIFATLEAQDLNAETQIDRFFEAVDEFAQDGDFILPGCCLNYPFLYDYRDTDYFTFKDDIKRLILIPTERHPVTALLEMTGQPENCIPEMWHNFEVYICPR